MLKYMYLPTLSTIIGIFFLIISTEKLVSKEYIFEKNSYQQSVILKQISSISDKELVKIAKKINDDSVAGESDYAEILLTEAIRKNSKNIDAFLEMSRLIAKQPLSSDLKAKKRFGLVYQAFLMDKENPKTRYKLAEMLYELNQKELFEQLYQDTILKFPDHPETKLEKIKVLSDTDPDKVVELSEAVLKSNYDSYEFIPTFISALKQTTPSEQFTHTLLTYAEKYPNRFIWYNLGMEYIKEKKYYNAEYSFHKSIELGNVISGKLQLGVLQYRYQNKPKEAISNFRALLSNFKENQYISNNLIYFVHGQLATAMLVANDPNTKKELEFLARYSFQNRAYFISIMNEYIGQKKEKLIVPALKMAIKRDPLFSYPYNTLAKILETQNKHKQARALQKKFTILSSQNAQTW